MWWLILGLAGCSAALSAWLVLRRAGNAWADYEHRLQGEARQTLDDAFLFLDLAQFRRLWVIAGGLGVSLMAWWVGQGWGLLLVLVAVVLAPSLMLQTLRRRRLAQFDAQLPDLVLALAGALRAGAGVQPALRHIVAHAQAPLSQEFSLLLREQRLGLSFQEALDHLRQRMPTEPCNLVVSALNIAAQTGGGLADTLEGIAETLRARQHWLGRVKALTAQGRMQSHIMAALPVLLFLVLSQLEPQAMSQLWQRWYGGLVLLTIGILEIVGWFWIRRVVSIEV